MSFEDQPIPSAAEAQRIQDPELARLGALVVEASMRADLPRVAADHAQMTGIENPNRYGGQVIRVGAPDVPESSDSLYRSITSAGVEDLAESGIVRGARTAGKPNKTSGHSAYWNKGETGKGQPLGQSFIIEAPIRAAEAGWVTADKVTGVYGRDSDGRVKNVIA